MEAAALPLFEPLPWRILAIDPGPEFSAYVIYDPDGRAILDKGHLENGGLVQVMADCRANQLAIEMVASYGMAVGKEVFETVLWTGRFIQAWGGDGSRHRKVYRRDVKMHLCHSARATDANVRTALIDLFGGSKEKAVGTKKSPGPLYGISSHLWSALAIAVTAAETGPAR